MRQSIFFISLISMALLQYAPEAFAGDVRTETPDTLLITDQPSRIVITESVAGSVISVSGIDDNAELHEEITTEYPRDASVTARQSDTSSLSFKIAGFLDTGKKSGSGWDVYIDGICLGLSNPMGMGPDHGLQWSKSIEIGWLECFGVGYTWGKTAVSIGLGFDWRNYKITTSDRYLAATPEKGIEWAYDLPEGSHLKNSRLKVFSLQLPLLFRAGIPGSSLNVKVGPVFNFNTYASLLTKYDDAYGNRNELFTTAIRPRRFTLDIFGSLSLNKAVGLYVRYSPMKVMDAPGSLNFRPLTVGIGIGI